MPGQLLVTLSIILLSIIFLREIDEKLEIKYILFILIFDYFCCYYKVDICNIFHHTNFNWIKIVWYKETV